MSYDLETTDIIQYLEDQINETNENIRILYDRLNLYTFKSIASQTQRYDNDVNELNYFKWQRDQLRIELEDWQNDHFIDKFSEMTLEDNAIIEDNE